MVNEQSGKMNAEKWQEAMWQKVVAFHGHQCPGLAIGLKACQAVRERMGLDFSQDEELVCVTENDACCVDAVQVITGCTFGKGNLIYRGTGKVAFSFFSRQSGAPSLRLILKPFAQEMERDQRQQFVLAQPPEALFDFGLPGFPLPEQARIFKSVVCQQCGEAAPEHKMRLQEGKSVCLDCFQDYSRGF